MDTRKEDADVKTAPEAPARPAPGEPGPGPRAVPSEPLHGPVEVAEDSLDGLQTAFRALSVEEVVTQPVKRKRESEKDAGDEADEGEEQWQDLTNDPTFEGAPSASGLHASPSPITTSLPIPDRAAATSTPITNPLWQRAQALLACLPTPPMVWAHLPLRSMRQLLPVSRWLPALRRDGMRLNIFIHYPLLELMWMLLGMHLGMQP